MNNVVSKRILAIDAGNSRVKWGLHDGHEWFLQGAFATPSPPGATTPEDAFSKLPSDLQVDRILISNVAGTAVATHLKDALYGLGKPITLIESQAEQCGVTSRYQPPATLGTDRWAAMIAAHATTRVAPAPLLVVMAGTALTVDAITADGIFLGGVIVPGLALMRASLNRGTAQLPGEPGEYQAFPRNTLNAISTGAIEACSGAVQRMYSHLSAQTGEMPRCIAGGGTIHMLSPHLPFPVSINDNLVLDGLLQIASSPSFS
jgi:type III pantothenate kinase